MRVNQLRHREGANFAGRNRLRNELESAGRRAVEAVLLWYQILEAAADVSDSYDAGRQETFPGARPVSAELISEI